MGNWGGYFNPTSGVIGPYSKLVLAGSPHLGSVVSNHGDSKSPKDGVGLVMGGLYFLP